MSVANDFSLSQMCFDFSLRTRDYIGYVIHRSYFVSFNVKHSVSFSQITEM